MDKYINLDSVRYLITQGERNVDKIVIKLPLRYGDVDLTSLNYVIRGVNDTKNTITEKTLPKTVTAEAVELDFTIDSNFTAVDGPLAITVRGFSQNSENIIKFNGGTLFVKKSIGIYNPPQDILEQALNEVQGGVIEATTQAKIATEQADIATTNAEITTINVSVSTENVKSSKAFSDNALKSSENAKESEIKADDSETKATQSLKDLIAMLGTDIATLTDKKLTPSQIPNLSINDVFEVATIEEMVLLTAQRGDVALIIPVDVVTDSYILSADIPTDLNNWKKLGVSYVANAGHSKTATNAENANTINNKRIISMTQEQYDNAVKDPNTYYFVGD